MIKSLHWNFRLVIKSSEVELLLEAPLHFNSGQVVHTLAPCYQAV